MQDRVFLRLLRLSTGARAATSIDHPQALTALVHTATFHSGVVKQCHLRVSSRGKRSRTPLICNHPTPPSATQPRSPSRTHPPSSLAVAAAGRAGPPRSLPGKTGNPLGFFAFALYSAAAQEEVSKEAFAAKATSKLTHALRDEHQWQRNDVSRHPRPRRKRSSYLAHSSCR